MTEQDITQYVMWTRNVFRNEERPVVSRLRDIHNGLRASVQRLLAWTGFFSWGMGDQWFCPNPLYST